MAKKNSAVLWTVEQTLGDDNATKKTNRERARHNVGIRFEPTAGTNQDQPPAPSGNTLSFVDKIDEAADGTLTYTRKTVTVNNSITGEPDIPVSGKAVSDKISNSLNYADTVVANQFVTKVDETAGVISVTRRQPVIADVDGLQTALDNLQVFYATTSTTFAQLTTAYNTGRPLVFINGSLSYALTGISKTNNQPSKFQFTNPYTGQSSVDVDGDIYNTFVQMNAWECDSNGWTNVLTTRNIACQDYCDYRVGILQTGGDISISTGDKLIISDTSDNGKEVRSSIAFDTASEYDHYFLNKNGSWVTALNAYMEASPNDITLKDIKIDNFIGATSTLLFRHGDQHLFLDAGHAFVQKPSSNASDGYVLTARYNDTYTQEDTGYFEWAPIPAYTAGIDINITNREVAVNTTSSMDAYSSSYQSSCFAIGQSNRIENSVSSLIGGLNSKIYSGSSVLVFGEDNRAGSIPSSSVDNNTQETTYTYYGFDNSILLGKNNTLSSSNNNFIWGTNNLISNSPDNTGVITEHGNNIIFGSTNQIQGGKCNTVIGYNNLIPSQSPLNACPSYITMIGHHLTWSDYTLGDILILGRYNEATYSHAYDGISGNPIRITGGGYNSGGTETRINIEELYPDGTLWTRKAVETSKATVNQSDNSVTKYSNTMRINPTTGDGGIYSQIQQTIKYTVSSSYNKKYTQFSYLTPTSLGLSDVYDPNDTVPNNEIVTNVSFNRILTGAADYYDIDPSTKMPTRAISLDFTAKYLGSVGISLTRPAVPAIKWDGSTQDTIEYSWLRINGPRANATQLPWDANAGNLEVGKLAVKFYMDTDFSTNPLIPGQKVGDITFIVGDPDASTHDGFYIYDLGDYEATPQRSKHNEAAYIHSGREFCMLMTIKASEFSSSGILTKPGLFSCLHC